MISIFADKNSDRLSYILSFFFEQKGYDFQIINSVESWSKIKSLRINYSNQELPCEYHIKPHGLLEREITFENISLTISENNIFIDNVKDEFATVFWMLSRMEEYDPSATKDEHGRYVASNSVLVKLHLNLIPQADDLVKQVWKKLGLDYSIVQNKFEGVPSFDIDVAWAFKNRTIVRSIGGAFKHGDWLNRIKVWTKRSKDPYDTYDLIHDVATRVRRIICFTLLADNTKFDKNIQWKNYNYQSLIRSLNSIGGMGIHPSYYTSDSIEKLEEEIKRLEEIVGHEIVKSRQHFLKLSIPHTYQTLIKHGIQRDFSMGYADQIGFRAGTSFPFYFFDLSSNKSTNLLIFPFAYMDGALKDQLKYSPEMAISINQHLINSVKEVGGVFMCIWHNSSIGNYKDWNGWLPVFEHTIKELENFNQEDFNEDYF